MNWARSIASVFLLLWSGTAWAATLTWDANREPDLAGYRIYQCDLLPCNRSSGNLLATVGPVTSFTLYTPAVPQFYFITAYDSANNESGNSNLVIGVPAGSLPPPPPPLATINLTVVGNPLIGMWGVKGSTTDLRDVMATIYLDGVVHHVEHRAPYGFPANNGMMATTGRFGGGSHTVEFVFFLEGTATEVGRESVTVREWSP